MYKRIYYQQVISRLNEQRMHIQVLIGPRQVGKTTLIQQVLEEYSSPYDSYTADDVPNVSRDWLAQVWETARMKMQVNKETEHLLVVDEIQKITNWSETVKSEWDRDSREKRNLKVVLLGSSRTLIMQGLTESLAGRFELIRLPHWTLTEMQEAFGIDWTQYVYYGGFPGAVPLIGDFYRWKQYVIDSLIEPAISKDVFLSTKIMKPQLMRQLFEIGCCYSGQELSLTKVVAQLQDAGNVSTIAGYLSLLDEAGLLGGLQKFAVDTARKYQSVPKFQVHNSAFRTVYHDLRLEQALLSPEEWGRYVESAIGAYLISQAPVCDYQLYYWRERNEEVDFVLSRRGKTIAIEVKSGRRSMNTGLVQFANKFQPFRSLVIGADGLDCETFLRMDLRQLFA